MFNSPVFSAQVVVAACSCLAPLLTAVEPFCSLVTPALAVVKPFTKVFDPLYNCEAPLLADTMFVFKVLIPVFNSPKLAVAVFN